MFFCKYCVHVIVSGTAKVGLQRFISSWNAHCVPNHGIPNELEHQRRGTISIHPLEIPTTTAALEQYREQGGTLTDPHPFATDPLEGHDGLKEERTRRFNVQVPYGNDYEQLFTFLMSGQSSNFITAINSLIHITLQLLPVSS